MKPTKVLSDEHRVIEIMLSCLDRMTKETAEAGKLDREAAEQAVDFIRNFADGCHHHKEEDHLFTELVRAGMPSESGPVGQMLAEHEQGRAYVRGMAENIEAASKGDADAMKSFAENSTGYVALLRSHIMKEDQVLFPMADRVLSDDLQAQLMQKFDSVEAEEMGSGTHEKYTSIVETLAKRYGVSYEHLPSKSCGCNH